MERFSESDSPEREQDVEKVLEEHLAGIVAAAREWLREDFGVDPGEPPPEFREALRESLTRVWNQGRIDAENPN